MLSSSRLKQIRTLRTIKGRSKESLFLVEGRKLIKDFLYKSNLINNIIIAESEYPKCKSLIKFCKMNSIENFIVPNKIIKKISDTKTPSGLLGTCKIRLNQQKDFMSNRWLYLHKVKDPGNLGTLLRTAAWFNIKNIGLSIDCADPYNSKVVRSAMGAHIYINIYQKMNLNELIENNFLLIGAHQNGKDKLEASDLSRKIALCLGGESKGFDNKIIDKINKLISINKTGHGESLNVAIAGSIFMNDISQK